MVKVSVALCTYNGERYIAEQLKSIISQTRAVDEIIICDDRSTDHTIDEIEHLQVQTNIPIRLYVNEVNIGVRANFRKALGLCNGDIVFLCDQDDVWFPNKVDYILKWFQNKPQKEVVFTDAVFIDSTGKPFVNGVNLLRSVGMTSKALWWLDKGYGMELFLKNNKATGATMAIKKNIISESLSLIDTNVNAPFHDAIISILAIQKSSLGCITAPLIKYRIHSSQNCGLNNILNPLKTDNALSPLNDYMVLGEYLTDAHYVKRFELLKLRKVWVTNGSFRDMFNNMSLYCKTYSEFAFLFFVRDICLCIKHVLFR